MKEDKVINVVVDNDRDNAFVEVLQHILEKGMSDKAFQLFFMVGFAKMISFMPEKEISEKYEKLVKEFSDEDS